MMVKTRGKIPTVTTLKKQIKDLEKELASLYGMRYDGQDSRKNPHRYYSKETNKGPREGISVSLRCRKEVKASQEESEDTNKQEEKFAMPQSSRKDRRN